MNFIKLIKVHTLSGLTDTTDSCILSILCNYTPPFPGLSMTRPMMKKVQKLYLLSNSDTDHIYYPIIQIVIFLL